MNCITSALDKLHAEGGRFVAAGSRRGPLMHVWHESREGRITRYEPTKLLPHWSRGLLSYAGRTVDTPQRQARIMTCWQIVFSTWVLAITATAWMLHRGFRRIARKFLA